MTLMQLHNLLKIVEAGKKKSRPISVATGTVLSIHQGNGKKRKTITQSNWKAKAHIGE